MTQLEQVGQTCPFGLCLCNVRKQNEATVSGQGSCFLDALHHHICEQQQPSRSTLPDAAYTISRAVKLQQICKLLSSKGMAYIPVVC